MTVRMSSRPSRMLAATPGACCSSRRARLRTSRSALSGVVQFPGLTQRRADRGVQRLWQPLEDVARLVDLAALDRGVAAKGFANRLGQRFGSVDDEQSANLRIQSALDQVVEQ